MELEHAGCNELQLTKSDRKGDHSCVCFSDTLQNVHQSWVCRHDPRTTAQWRRHSSCLPFCVFTADLKFEAFSCGVSHASIQQMPAVEVSAFSWISWTWIVTVLWCLTSEMFTSHISLKSPGWESMRLYLVRTDWALSFTQFIMWFGSKENLYNQHSVKIRVTTSGMMLWH